MHLKTLHPWNLEPAEAIRWQERLRQELVLAWQDRQLNTVAGVDVAYRAGWAYAALAILDFPAQTLRFSVTARVGVNFPYIPGLLAFREGPAVLAAWEQLAETPDLLLFDGHGIAHPRGIGLAAHLGLWLEVPTIGVAKTRLYGQHAAVGARPGDRAELYDEAHPGQAMGVALRTSPIAKPIYVSPGHRMDLPHAIDFVLACCRGNRLPEPLRLAHQIAGHGRTTSSAGWMDEAIEIK